MARTIDTDVAVIGAGPYGLSVSAHLAGRGIRHETFGTPMDTWRRHMPAGMYLKSEGFASNLSDPGSEYSLERFCRESGIEYARSALPIGRDTFARYGQWFQERAVPGLDTRLVERLSSAPQGFALELSGGESLLARRVVVATGIQGQAYLPPELRGLPEQAVLHTYDQRDPADSPRSGTVVLGAGQSALEAAALIEESGRPVRLLARTAAIAWLSRPGGRARSLRQRLRYPESGLGEGRAQWVYSNRPLAFHAMRERWRLDKAFSALGPAGAWWLRPRFEGHVDVRLQQRLVEGRAEDGGVRLRLRGPAGLEEMATERIVAGTGYRPDLSALGFLDPGLRAKVATVAGAPVLGRSFESSVSGLYFVGYLAAPSFGPLMRFVFGARFAALRVTRRVAARNGD
jgi:L-lysine 6-monooxygenase/L-ornithine 5-monooxygenase